MNNNETLANLVEEAKKAGSYYVALTIRDKDKTKRDSAEGGGDLTHYALQEDFPIDDIVPSIDACVRSMNIKPEQPVQVVIPEIVYKKRKPMKIAIITHFNRCPDSFSPGKAVKNQIKILRSYGHEVVFFTQEGSTLNIGCEMRPVVPKFKRQKNIVNEEIKAKFIDVLRQELTDDFDLAITHDFYIDDCITYREAVRECGVPIKWLHWARSGVGRPINYKMDNARYVYMNYADVGRFANRIGVSKDLVRVVFNEKDPSLMFRWNPVTKMISDRMRLWEKDVIQVYPICTTRMDAKGMNSVIRVFAQLKNAGKNVALVICNSNGRKRVKEIDSKLEFAESLGLVRDKDICFTSTFANEEYKIESEVPHEVVSQLFGVSNLFVFPTSAEVCSNVLLEASMSKNLIVLNSDLPSLFDFADKNSVLSHPFTSAHSIHYSGRDDASNMTLAKQIIGQLESNKADKQFRHVWSVHNIHSIYREMLEPILFEDI